MKNTILGSKNEAVLSGYVRYRPSNGTYYLMTNSRRLCNVFSEEDRVKVTISREEGHFVIHRNSDGNILTRRSKELVTCISGKSILTASERETLTHKETKLSFPVKVKIFPEEFGIDRYQLYPDQDAAKLARTLSKKGVQIPKRIMTPKAFPHDLEFSYGDKKVVIEITQASPSVKNYLNFRHQPQGGSVRAHIFDIYRRCVNARLSKNNNIIGFVILDSNWKEHNHVNQLVPELEKINCHLLFTNFDSGWEKGCTEDLLRRIKNE